MLHIRSRVKYDFNRLDESLQLAKEAYTHFQQIGSELNPSEWQFAELAWMKGEYEQAETLYLKIRERHSLLGEKRLGASATGVLGVIAMEQGEIMKAKGYFEETLDTAREFKVDHLIVWGLAFLSNSIFWDGDKKKLRQYVDEGARLAKSLPITIKSIFLLYLLEAFRTYDKHNTTVILGALDKYQKEDAITPIKPSDILYYDRAEKYEREVLGLKAFESAFAEGQKMSLDEALDLVLKSVEEE